MKTTNPEKAKILLRVSMAIVFLYFGMSQLKSPDEWTGMVPEAITGTIITANNLVVANGLLEVTLGIFLLIGLYTRASALLLSIHLAFITFHIGLNAIGIRDFGLTIATVAIFFNGTDKFCLDKKYDVDIRHMQINHLIK